MRGGYDVTDVMLSEEVTQRWSVVIIIIGQDVPGSWTCAMLCWTYGTKYHTTINPLYSVSSHHGYHMSRATLHHTMCRIDNCHAQHECHMTGNSEFSPSCYLA